MSELYDSIDYNNLKFEYVGPTENVSFYEYMDSKELFNKLKETRISFSDAQKKQEDFLKKLNEVQIRGKNNGQKKVINDLNKFLKITLKCSLMLVTKQNRMKQQEQDLKY